MLKSNGALFNKTKFVPYFGVVEQLSSYLGKWGPASWAWFYLLKVPDGVDEVGAGMLEADDDTPSLLTSTTLWNLYRECRMSSSGISSGTSRTNTTNVFWGRHGMGICEQGEVEQLFKCS